MRVFPFQGPRSGKTAVLETLAAIGKDYALQTHTPEIVIVEGDRAAVMANVAFVQRATERRVDSVVPRRTQAMTCSSS